MSTLQFIVVGLHYPEEGKREELKMKIKLFIPFRKRFLNNDIQPSGTFSLIQLLSCIVVYIYQDFMLVLYRLIIRISNRNKQDFVQYLIIHNCKKCLYHNYLTRRKKNWENYLPCNKEDSCAMRCCGNRSLPQQTTYIY